MSLQNAVASLPENTTAVTKVADIVVVDDALGTATLALLGPDSALFDIVGTELFLKAGQQVDFETNPVLDVTVTVDDTAVGGPPDSSAPLSIAVTNVNERPTDIALDDLTVPEETAGAVVGNVTVTDPDAGDTHTLTVSDGRFEVVGGQLKLKAGVRLDFDTQPTVNLNLTARDAGGLELTEGFAITVSALPTHVEIADNLVGAAGGTVVVPLVVVNDAKDVASADFEIHYDTALLDVVSHVVNNVTVWHITAGNLWPGATVTANVNETAGTLRISIYGVNPLGTGTGSLVNIEFEVSLECGRWDHDGDRPRVRQLQRESPPGRPGTGCRPRSHRRPDCLQPGLCHCLGTHRHHPFHHGDQRGSEHDPGPGRLCPRRGTRHRPGLSLHHRASRTRICCRPTDG